MIPPRASPPGPKQTPPATRAPPAHPKSALAGCHPIFPISCPPLIYLHKSNSLAALLLRRHTTAELFRDSCFHPILLNVVSKSLRKSIRLTIDILGLSTQTQSDVGEHLWQHINNSTKLREGTQSRVNLRSGFCGDQVLSPFCLLSMTDKTLLRHNFTLN